MKKEPSTYELDPEKRDSLTRAALDKMLREIKAELQRNRKLKVIITPADDD